MLELGSKETAGSHVVVATQRRRSQAGFVGSAAADRGEGTAVTKTGGAGDDGAPQPGDERLLTTNQAAQLIGYGVTRTAVMRWAREGEIASIKRGPGTWMRIPESAALAKREEFKRELAEAKARAEGRNARPEPNSE